MSGETSTSQAASPVQAVLTRAAVTPRHVAIRVFESGRWVEYGWDDVARTVARLASLASAAGVRPGSVVGLACGSRVEWSLSVWAVSGLGATVVAVPADADAEALAAVVERQPALWILEDVQPFDGLAEIDASDASRLVLDVADLHPETRRGIYEWERDVLNPVLSDDATRLADLQAAVDAVDPQAIALELPGEGDLGLSHATLAAGSDEGSRPGLVAEDEYLAFLPSTWAIEAHLLVGNHPVSGAVVSFGSRAGGGLREMAAVQPTVVHAPAEWWQALASTVIRSAAEPALFAKRALATLLRGDDSFSARLARRTLSRRMGLARLRDARSLGPVGDDDASVLAGLRVPLGEPLMRPRPLDAVAVTDAPVDSGHLEEAK